MTGVALRSWTPSSRPSTLPSTDAAPTRVGMPHLNAGGLSEGWLFRHAGDQLWQALGARWGAPTSDLRSESGGRLYPTFLAVRATYRAPLSAVSEDDRLANHVALTWAARGYNHGFVTLTGERNRLRFEMLTMLAARSPAGELRAAQPSARSARTTTDLGPDGAPALVALAKAARNGARHDDAFAGEALARPVASMGNVRYEPSPYTDFNGAGLLYFASFVSIADTAERVLCRASSGAPRADWAVATSTLRRDVFYYGNIQLGDAVSTHLLAIEWGPADTVKTHLRIVRERDGRKLADLVTLKQIARNTP
jgi:probable biosynthetic protein (TIGR04098 family)